MAKYLPEFLDTRIHSGAGQRPPIPAALTLLSLPLKVQFDPRRIFHLLGTLNAHSDKLLLILKESTQSLSVASDQHRRDTLPLSHALRTLCASLSHHPLISGCNHFSVKLLL